jgi:hypothetical protein
MTNLDGIEEENLMKRDDCLDTQRVTAMESASEETALVDMTALI